MKILYLTDQTYLHGGIEKVLSQKANYLADILNHEVTVLTYNQKSNKSCYFFSEKIKFIDLEINYEIGKSYFHLHNLKKIPKHKSSLKKIFKKLRPDVVISCNFGPDFYFLPFVEQKIPKIKEFHASRFFTKQNKAGKKDVLLQKLSQWIEKKYSSIVVLNESEVGFYSSKSIIVIPNPAEIGGERADLTKNRILAAGRIAPVKNFGDLIEAFSLLNKEFPTWELHFFGENYNGTKEELEKKIKILDLQDQIKFKGVTEHLKKEMQNYSIYAMTSETECFPMVLLEALSVGLPIVSYDSPTGPKHILTHNDDSFLVPYKNIAIFAKQLKVLMLNENLSQEMGDRGIENVQRFSLEKVMQQWKNLFNELI